MKYQFQNTYSEVKVKTSLRTDTHWVRNYSRGLFLDVNYPYANHDSFVVISKTISQKEYSIATGFSN